MTSQLEIESCCLKHLQVSLNTIALRISVGADDWIAERANGDGKPNWNEVKEAKKHVRHVRR